MEDGRRTPARPEVYSSAIMTSSRGGEGWVGGWGQWRREPPPNNKPSSDTHCTAGPYQGTPADVRR